MSSGRRARAVQYLSFHDILRAREKCQPGCENASSNVPTLLTPECKRAEIFVADFCNLAKNFAHPRKCTDSRYLNGKEHF